MRTFMQTVTMVLIEAPEITELPQDELRAFAHSNGELVAGEVDTGFALKLARLQTLLFREQENSGTPEHEQIQVMAELQGTDYLSVAAKQLNVQEDGTRRVMMLERMIIELVREKYPGEGKYSEVVYFLSDKFSVVRQEAPRMRFFD